MKVVLAASTLLNLLQSWNVVTSNEILQQKLWGLPSGLAYYVQVNIGSPLYSSSSPPSSSANAFNLLLDTGSANTAVATAKCCSLPNEKLYSCADSSTCVDQGTNVNVNYVSGSWTGQLVLDVFSGQGLGIVKNMPFAEITSEDGFLSSGDFDGIIGLAYPTIASPSSDPRTPYFDHVQSVYGLSNIFSLQMCGVLQLMDVSSVLMADSTNLYAGELLLGGMEGPNRERYYKGEIVYTPLVQEKYFNVIVTDIGINGQSLGLDCKMINSPRAIIDSGSSNLIFPSSVYNAVIAELKSQVEEVTSDISDFLFNDGSACCSSECDPTNVNSIIHSLPGLTISLAVDDEKLQQMTVTIPAEYIWRPLVISAGQDELACRVFGISEGAFTLLGNVFMDGLFTVHDRENERVGLAVADNCPNGVTSSKIIKVETVGADKDFCDCVGSTDRKRSLLSSYISFSNKPCFFWQWWMHVIIVTMVVIVLMGVAYCYLWWKRRKLMRQHEAHQSQHQPNVQRNVYSDDHYDLLQTPTQQSSAFFVEASTLPTTTASARNRGIPATSGYRLALSPSFCSNTMGAHAADVPRHKPSK
ncbi:unnamed protein product [Peronospora farinosa]|uniref:Peptidase A1 domain-containing protein n=1 Tax=Peronospora farinosa TaxID=134698 RepID=A0AAV0UV13_9STRA|nr:unnamed protein product [Peronospora farinosa]CAI5740765.1 unnamed protein product [Peronospora farinosa]